MKTKTLGLLWLGAAISIAEIYSGSVIASLGFQKGIAAIIIGHLIGGIFLYLGAVMGVREKKGAIELTSYSFGKWGVPLFSILNVLQLVGWTVIMIQTATISLNHVTSSIWNIQSSPAWITILTVVLLLWISFEMKKLSYFNNIMVVLLSVLILLTTVLVFRSSHHEAISGTMTFGNAVELSVTMPLSWLPLVADYTRNANGKWASLVTAVSYFVGSCFMYILGMKLMLVTGSADPVVFLLQFGLGMVALFVILFSTITTAYLDAMSAGISMRNIMKLSEKRLALILTVLSGVLALFFSMDKYESFLYGIGSVFSPLFAIIFTDYFILRSKAHVMRAFLLWIVGVILYYILLPMNIFIGPTIIVMLIIGTINILLEKIKTKVVLND